MESNETLPIANVGRIMKQILPERAKISKEGKQVMQECVTEFISFVTGEASDKCQKENQKTLNGDDISWALSSLGFDNYAEAITRYLYKYRQAEKHKLLLNNCNHNHNYNRFHDGGGGDGAGDDDDKYEGSASRRRSKHGEEEEEEEERIECRVSTKNHPTPPTNQLSICLSDED